MFFFRKEKDELGLGGNPKETTVSGEFERKEAFGFYLLP
jgi:hypothetical protein